MTSSPSQRLLGVSNLVIILLAVGLGYRLVAPAKRVPVARYEAGERLASIALRDLERHQRTLLINIKSTCPHCLASLPFYRQLMANARLHHADVQFTVVTFEPTAVCEELLRSNGVTPDTILQPRGADPKLMTVPDLLLVDRNGLVLRRWLGALSRGDQRDVSRAVTDRPS